ncbi:Uncharacterised protein [Shigella sonnei]|nr:Uncharacterised protein [Shigella sonnei]
MLCLAAILANGFAGALCSQPRHKFAGFLSDNSFRLNRCGFTLRQVVRNDALQIVHTIKISIRQFANFRLNIARNGNIHQQHWLVTTTF